MVQRFKDTDHPVFTGDSALSRGTPRRLKGKETIHLNADSSNTEPLFRIIHSVNQLSIYGAVSQWSEQFDLSQKERESTWAKSAEREELVVKEALEIANKEKLKSMNSQEVNSLVTTARNQPASGNRLGENVENLELRSRIIRIAKISDLASFLDPVTLGRRFQTHQDVDDGFGGYTAAC